MPDAVQPLHASPLVRDTQQLDDQSEAPYPRDPGLVIPSPSSLQRGFRKILLSVKS